MTQAAGMDEPSCLSSFITPGYKWHTTLPIPNLSYMSTSNSNNKASETPVTPLLGGCHCGAVTYEVSVPPIPADPDIDPKYKNSLVTPSIQKHTERGSRPNQNKWRACHCHCEACRRTAGSLMVDWVTIPATDIIVTRKGATGVYKTSGIASREFVSALVYGLYMPNLNLYSARPAELPSFSIIMKSQILLRLMWLHSRP